ncbi:MAG TPA: hypothetical protein PLB01_02125 [Thermoanaerobaculia bacterium]|nr:hypothetical protein [Thermoanaerobaculia bacterium]
MVLPYHAWDAWAFGEWSRLIAEEPRRFFFPDLYALTYQRPFFYVLQGWLWATFGFHEALGRMLALAFAILCAWTTKSMARSLDGGRGTWRWACLLPFAIPDFLTWCAAGTTDVPAAALLAATGAILLGPVRPVPKALLVLVLSTSAALTKPTAIPSLVGLACAAAVSWPGVASPRRRVLAGVVPILSSLGIAGAYFFWLASRLGISVRSAIVGELDGYYADLASRARWSALYVPSWLGPAAGPILAVALLALTISIAFRRPVHAARTAAAVALLALGWRFATAGWGGPGSREFLVSIATLVLVAAAARGTAANRPVSAHALFFLVWAAPPCFVWIAYLGYDARLLSPGWPPLLLLAWIAFEPAAARIAGTRERAFALAAGAVLAAASLRHVDGLDLASARCVARSVIAAPLDTGALRECFAPGFERERHAVASALSQAGRSSIISNDGRLRFFFPGQVAQMYPATCGDLSGYGAFALLTDPGSRRYMAAKGIPADPSVWAACRGPRASLVFQDPAVSVFTLSP